MSLTVTTNLAAMHAYRSLSESLARMDEASAHLASGQRIATAGDDAAGLSIAQGLRTHIDGMEQVLANVDDAMAVTDIADGALGSVQQILQRMRALVLEAANSGAQGFGSLTAISDEINRLNSYLSATAAQTRYGAQTVVDGSYSGTFQVGVDGGTNMTLDLTSANADSRNVGGGAGEWTNISPPGNTPQWRWVGDTSGVDLTRMNIASFSMGYQPMSYADGQWSAAGLLTSNTYSQAAAHADLAALGDAATRISSAQAQVGAVANQLGHTGASVRTTRAAVMGSYSSLVDADIGVAATNLAGSRVRAYTAAAVLGKANEAPRGVVRLLDQSAVPAQRKSGEEGSARSGGAGSGGGVHSGGGSAGAAGPSDGVHSAPGPRSSGGASAWSGAATAQPAHESGTAGAARSPHVGVSEVVADEEQGLAGVDG